MDSLPAQPHAQRCMSFSEAPFSLASIIGSPHVRYGHNYDCNLLRILALCLALAHQLGILHYNAEVASSMRLGNNLYLTMNFS